MAFFFFNFGWGVKVQNLMIRLLQEVDRSFWGFPGLSKAICRDSTLSAMAFRWALLLREHCKK